MRSFRMGRVVAAGVLAGAVAVGVEAGSSGLTSASAQTITATCTNSSTDSATIQNAINASAVGDTIQITGGTCDITSMLVLAADRTYTGTDTTGTVLYQANGENLTALMAPYGWVHNSSYVDDGIRIEHMTLNGNYMNNTGTDGIIIRNYNYRVTDVHVENMPSDGILITDQSESGTAAMNGSINSIISDSWIDGFGNVGVQDTDSGNGITDNTLTGNWINSNAATGQTGIEDVDLVNAAGWDIHDNHLYGPVAKDAIEADRCYNTTIASNYIEEFGQAGGAGQTWYGISCDLQGGAGNVISDNKLYYDGSLPSTGSYDYIGVYGNYGTTLASVTGNAILGTGTTRETGLSYVAGGASSMTVASTGNAVSGVGTARSSSGATVSAGS